MATEFKSEDVGLESWIDEGVSFLQAEVTIYRNPAMFAKYGPLMERLQILRETRKPKKDKKERSLEESVGGEVTAWEAKEESLGDSFAAEIDEEIEAVEAEAQALWDEYAADTEVWTLRRLNAEEVEEVKNSIGPLPEQPMRPSSTKMSTAQVKTQLRKMEAWALAMAEYRDELSARCLPLAVMSVKVKGEDKPVPSVEGFLRLKKRPGGDEHFAELVAAMSKLTAEGVSIMAPHSEGTGA